MMHGGIVVVGTGTAGLLAAQAARGVDRERSVTLISAEACLPYSPTSLPYLLSGRATKDNLFCRTDEFFSSQRIQFVAGRRVVVVDPARRVISFSDGDEMAFEKLVIATGASPIKPPIEGTDARGVFVLRTVADAEAIHDYSRGKRNVTVLGAGFIGMEVALGFVEKGMDITVVEREDRVMPLNFDEPASRLIQGIFERHGVCFRLGSTMTRVCQNSLGEIEGVRLANGDVLESDLLVVAVGVNPQTEIVRGSGIACGRGIIVDDEMRTNFPDILAAGDVAEAQSFGGDHKMLNAILPDAAEQGRVAGANAAGASARYTGGLPMNILNFLNNTAFSIGEALAQGEPYEVYCSDTDNRYRKLVFKENRLVGAILLNDQTRPGFLWALVKNRADISRVKRELLLSSVQPDALLAPMLGTILGR